MTDESKHWLLLSRAVLLFTSFGIITGLTTLPGMFAALRKPKVDETHEIPPTQPHGAGSGPQGSGVKPIAKPPTRIVDVRPQGITSPSDPSASAAQTVTMAIPPSLEQRGQFSSWFPAPGHVVLNDPDNPRFRINFRCAPRRIQVTYDSQEIAVDGNWEFTVPATRGQHSIVVKVWCQDPGEPLSVGTVECVVEGSN